MSSFDLTRLAGSAAPTSALLSGPAKVVNLHLRSLPGAKARVFWPLGWNSYGTERAQPVAKLRLAGGRKMA
jgi:hypothetical protein